MNRLPSLLACLLICTPSVVADDVAPLPITDIKLQPWGVGFIGSDGVDTEEEWYIFDPVAFELAIDPVTIDDCLATAQIACPHGVKRFYYRAGDPAICEFECFPGTGGGQ